MNDDLISREALKKSMRKSMNERYISWTKTITVADIATLIFDEITYAPTVLHDNYSMGYQDGVRKVLSERPQGEWIELKTNPPEFFGHKFYICSLCNREIDVILPEGSLNDYPFCHCGADMRGKEEENDS